MYAVSSQGVNLDRCCSRVLDWPSWRACWRNRGGSSRAITQIVQVFCHTTSRIYPVAASCAGKPVLWNMNGSKTTYRESWTFSPGGTAQWNRGIWEKNNHERSSTGIRNVHAPSGTQKRRIWLIEHRRTKKSTWRWILVQTSQQSRGSTNDFANHRAGPCKGKRGRSGKCASKWSQYRGRCCKGKNYNSNTYEDCLGSRSPDIPGQTTKALTKGPPLETGWSRILNAWY